MLPDSYDMVAHGREHVVCLLILCDVPFYLRYPVILVALDVLFPVLPVIAMPEITIAENRDSVFLDGDIRMAIDRRAVLSESEPATPESTGENPFD